MICKTINYKQSYEKHLWFKHVEKHLPFAWESHGESGQRSAPSKWSFPKKWWYPQSSSEFPLSKPSE